MGWLGRERRQYERVKTAVPCRLQVGDRVLTGTTRDLSLGGICFAVELDENARAHFDAAKGTTSAILPRGTIESRCRVVRVEPGAIAAQFVDFKGTADRDRLREFLETQLSKVTTVVPDGRGSDD